MAKYFSDTELQEMLKLPEEEAVAATKKRFPRIFETAAAVTEVKAAFAKRAAPPEAPGPEAAIFGGAGVGLGAGIVVSRLTELVKGTTITYDAPLDAGEMVGRLITALSDFSVRLSGGQIVVTQDETAAEFCRIRVSVSGDQTTVVTSGLKFAIDKKRGGRGLLNDLVGVGRNVLSGQGLDGVLDFVTDTALAAAEAGSDLWVANTLAGTIEKYGAEQERKANTARFVAQTKAARIVVVEGLLGSCQSCGQELPEDGSGNCGHCGATTEVAVLRAELARLQKS